MFPILILPALGNEKVPGCRELTLARCLLPSRPYGLSFQSLLSRGARCDGVGAKQKYHVDVLYDDGDRERAVQSHRLRRLGRPPRDGGLIKAPIPCVTPRVGEASCSTPSAIFCYGTLRPDFSSEGDAWGVTKGSVWERGSVDGFTLHQQDDESFPFALKTNRIDQEGVSRIHGTLITWQPCDLVRRLRMCDEIEGG